MNLEWIWMLVSFILTLLVFSYLFGDNFLFRLATYLFVGVTAGYVTTMIIYQVIWPRIVLPLVNGSTDQRIMAAVPLLLGVLLLFKLFPQLSSIGSLPMGYLVGIGAALAVGGAVMGTIFSQVGGTIALFDFRSPTAEPISPFVRVLESILILLGTLSTLVFFHFNTRNKQSAELERAKWIETLSKIGQVFIAITFGALFAGVYLTAIAALVDRLDFIKEVIEKIVST